MAKDTISTAQIYELVDRKMGEVLEVVNKLHEEFQKLEAGRLTRVESGLAELKAKVDVESVTNQPVRAYVYDAIKLILAGVIGAIVMLVLKKPIV